MQMQIVSMQNDRKGSQRIATIAVDIGQYHFITWDGWREQWITQSPSEWWKKQQWLKEGGWDQEFKR